MLRKMFSISSIENGRFISKFCENPPEKSENSKKAQHNNITTPKYNNITTS